MKRVGAVDIGTNSVRLLVADIDGVGRDAKLQPVERLMRITRLGQGVDGDRRLHPDAIARTLAVLDQYGAVARTASPVPTATAPGAQQSNGFFGAASARSVCPG